MIPWPRKYGTRCQNHISIGKIMANKRLQAFCFSWTKQSFPRVLICYCANYCSGKAKYQESKKKPCIYPKIGFSELPMDYSVIMLHYIPLYCSVYVSEYMCVRVYVFAWVCMYVNGCMFSVFVVTSFTIVIYYCCDMPRSKPPTATTYWTYNLLKLLCLRYFVFCVFYFI